MCKNAGKQIFHAFASAHLLKGAVTNGHGKYRLSKFTVEDFTCPANIRDLVLFLFSIISCNLLVFKSRPIATI